MGSAHALLAAAGAVAVAFAIALRRATELFFVSVRRGRVLVVRGAVPPALLLDLSEIVRRARPRHGSLRAVRRAGGAVALEVDGAIDGATAQRLRNAFGLVPAARIKAAARAPRRSRAGMGVAWLAWWAHERSRSRAPRA